MGLYFIPSFYCRFKSEVYPGSKCRKCRKCSKIAANAGDAANAGNAGNAAKGAKGTKGAKGANNLLLCLFLLLLLILLRYTTHQLLLVSFVFDLHGVHNKIVASTIRRKVKRTLSTMSK